MQVLFSTGSLPWLPLNERFRIIAAAGADGIELLLTPHLIHRDPFGLAQRARDFGVPIRAVHAVLAPWRDCTTSELRDSVHFAQTLPDCTVVVVHPPRPIAHAHYWLRALQAARMERDARLKVGVEILGQHTATDRPAPYDSIELFLRFVEEWDLAITFDTAHAASLGWDLVPSLHSCLPRLAHVHLSDAHDRDFKFALANALLRDHRLPGSGRLALGSVLRTLRSSGYARSLTLELSPVPLFAVRPRLIVQRLAGAIAAVRQWLNDPRDPSPSSIPGSTPETN
ncbi:sugar phosphate isomerase/epimerase [Thermomicrobium sp. 4228-Ro]|uniref:sugar phosphate isomerase/epimerase family protein n=1 Tax=Thermomicrobium sp. 4228-Ro TaxID=2993937 RepID=UPI0022494226|nr:sugar phosphate isomerase/epimerase [Thermomicrobium sp. 4228-Ro]MCX2725928.1 sugar phosphate isomerase/epimerase [Thermomicrobium sp. 4228-Ro]